MTTTRFKGWGPPPRPAAGRRLTYDADRRRLRLTEAGVTTTYHVEDVSRDGTRAFRLVCLDDDCCGECVVVLAGRRSECECGDSQKFGRCVHADALVALDRAGRLACRTRGAMACSVPPKGIRTTPHARDST